MYKKTRLCNTLNLSPGPLESKLFFLLIIILYWNWLYIAAQKWFNVHCFKQQISWWTIWKVNPFESLSMLFSELHCWMKCPFLVSTRPVLKFYENLKFHCGTEWWHKTLREKLGAIIPPSPPPKIVSTRTEDISKLNKETFPANRKCSQLPNIFSLHIGALKDIVCDNINTDSSGSSVMHEERGHEPLGAGAAGYDQWGQIWFCFVSKV